MAGKKKLTKREAEMLDKITELTETLQRNQADFENYRKRSEQEKAQSVSYGKRAVILELLPVIDNVGRALMHVPQELKEHDYVKGVQGVAKQLSDALEKNNVQKIKTVGQEFNPELMEAVLMEDGEGETEIVVEELQSGFMIDGEVVRHAMVKVGRK
jgi:molecular chaperone GrpE